MNDSPLFLLGGILLALGAAFCLLWFVVTPGGRAIPLSRRQFGAAARDSALTRLTNSSVGAVDTVLNNSRWAPVKEATLELAGLKMRRADFVLVVAVLAGATGVAGWAFIGLLAGVLFTFAVVAGSYAFLRIRTSKREQRFEEQLSDTLQMLSGNVKAGHSILRSVDSVAQETDEPTSAEFARVVNETRLGRDLGDALAATARRMHSEDCQWIAEAIGIHREVGGNLGEVLDQVGETIRERGQIKRQVRSLSAEGRMSGWVLTLLPVVMFVLLNLINPGYAAILTHSFFGIVLLVVAVILLVVGGLIMRKVVKIKF